MRAGHLRYLHQGAFRRLAYTDWGDPAAPAVVCVHGLTRNGRDFDALAEALRDRHRVVCPDLPGRGGSDWLPDPADYAPPVYVAALSHLLAVIGRPVAWVGTSLGGICGMVVASAADQPITRLVLNDVGPHIPAAALRRIAAYVGLQPRFPDLDAAEAHLRRVHADWGAIDDGRWAAMARHSTRALPEGGLALHHDPQIAAPMLGTEPADIDLSAFWDRVSVPTLVLRGGESDLLLPDTLAAMVRAGATAHVVPGAGHAPSLMDAPTIGVIRRFLGSAA